MKIAARSDTGMIRKSNQDSIYYNDRGMGVFPNLMVVADGMGGHKAGEKASELAVTGLVEQIMALDTKPEDLGRWLAGAAEEVNQQVYNAALSCPEWSGMGTTLVTAVCDQEMLYCINIGDSRLYVLEEMEDGSSRMRRVTVDHSVVEEMVACGMITRDEAWQHPQKNLITRAVGQELHVEADIYVESLAHIQMILVCSDGLSDMIEDREIEQILVAGNGNPEMLVETLKKTANDYGGRDNISVIVADMRGE